MLELRPYQQEAIDGVFRQWSSGVTRTLLVMPTGAGKSLCFARIAERFRREGGGRVLAMVHTTFLANQAHDNFRAHTSLRVGLEMGDRSVEPMFLPDVVVASVQTLSRKKRLESFGPRDFGMIILDEAHHSVSASWRSVMDHFGGARVLGTSATPDRLDGLGLGAIFESVAYTVELRDLMEKGYLCPLRLLTVRTDHVDFSKVRETAGDLNEADLAAILMEEQALHEVASPLVELAADRPTLVFCATVEHARAMAGVINRYRPGLAEAIDGSMDDEQRAGVIRRFRSGTTRFVCNCALLTEGVDLPFISCVAMARPTKSRALYTQAVGRALRTYPGKADALVIDFRGNAGRHSLVNCLDILDGNRDEAVRERALAIVAADPQLPLLFALDEAARQLADEARRAAIAEAQRREIERRRVQGKAAYQAVEVDPFTSIETVLGVRPRAGRWGGAPATERQIEALKRNGIELPEIDKGQASQILDALISRRERKLCTFKQARLLARHGIDPDLSFEDASRAIDDLSKAWRGRAA